MAGNVEKTETIDKSAAVHSISERGWLNEYVWLNTEGTTLILSDSQPADPCTMKLSCWSIKG